MESIQWTKEERNTILERGEVCYAVAEKAMERSGLSFDDIERINQHTENHRWGSDADRRCRGFRSPEQDCYGLARLCQVIGNFFGGGLSIGIDRCCNLDCDNYDNGVYIIKNWEIVGRQYFQGTEQDIYDLEEMIREIDACQPEIDRLYREDANVNTKHE